MTYHEVEALVRDQMAQSNNTLIRKVRNIDTMCNCGGCYKCLTEQGKVPANCPKCGKEYNNTAPLYYPFCSLACEDAAQIAFHSEVVENSGEAVRER